MSDCFSDCSTLPGVLYCNFYTIYCTLCTHRENISIYRPCSCTFYNRLYFPPIKTEISLLPCVNIMK